MAYRVALYTSMFFGGLTLVSMMLMSLPVFIVQVLKDFGIKISSSRTPSVFEMLFCLITLRLSSLSFHLCIMSSIITLVIKIMSC